jgi:hypothetical protein
MAKVESVVSPYSILDDFRRKSVPFIHSRFVHLRYSRRTVFTLSVPIHGIDIGL